MQLLDLMEPEETVGNIWHNLASDLGQSAQFPDQAVCLTDIRTSLAVLFRALHGNAQVDITEAAPTAVNHRQNAKRKLATNRDKHYVASFNGETLRLPPQILSFPSKQLNRSAYLWLTALAALASSEQWQQVANLEEGIERDQKLITCNLAATAQVLKTCPGLRKPFELMANYALAQRPKLLRPTQEQQIEQDICAALIHKGPAEQFSFSNSTPTAQRNYHPYAPVPIWLQFITPKLGAKAAEEEQDPAAKAPLAMAMANKKQGERKDNEQNRRSDSFIIHRFEAILSWVESMNINRSVDDDDDENAQKAADDQEKITLTKHNRKAATRLRLHLDLSPSDADHEKLAGKYVYPEWNYRTKSYMEDHCRVLDAPIQVSHDEQFKANPAHVRQVRRQFEALMPKRKIQLRQIEGSELDLDALITTQTDLMATGYGSDRIWQDSRQTERDLSVAFLIDTSRSTESAIGDTTVIDTAREAMTAMSFGIDAAGDKLGIWGFSSLYRDRVFLSRVKDFQDPMNEQIEQNIAALKPGHYTRLGTAIRHVGAQLATQNSARKLLIILTDGKPNDLDHYEGQFGIEDSHMAVRELRSQGMSLHAIVIDEDGQNWFTRIFGRGGFTLLPNPERLLRALPEIYRSLTKES
ncbi:nitric oxide reductase activation protein NorD [Polycladidibacter stylochi]|uniref:nitric oxide reductase activation protein NorD n=1 Tax=Polycladidibacter stylochi TaxID=1807766 RepID=UPI000835256D|nr:VWA domain-containing protein [Pseudovibrio stylochi]